MTAGFVPVRNISSKTALADLTTDHFLVLELKESRKIFRAKLKISNLRFLLLH